MFLILQTTAMRLDSGTLGISQLDALLLFLLIFGVTMVPYFFLYWALERKDKTSESWWQKALGWPHADRHPELVHH